jgi:tyrosine-specific transport protein
MLIELGCIFLILGTCVGAAMIALPVVTAHESYWLTIILVVSSWLVMTLGAWALTKVVLRMKPGSNLISMSQATLGKGARLITWIVYLLLLYSLISAYLASTSDVLRAIIGLSGAVVPHFICSIMVTGILGYIVYSGIGAVDFFNRFLMTIKLVIFAFLVGFMAPKANFTLLSQGSFNFTWSTWLVIICSFGFAIIMPTVSQYLNYDKKRIMRVLMIASVIPVLIYLIWIATVQGLLPRFGADGLVSLNHAADTNSALMSGLSAATGRDSLKSLSYIFISVSALTAFLGVSVCLIDFLADGLKKQKKGGDGLLIFTLTYLPPLVIVLFMPQVFTTALAYAGFFCLYILIFLPIAMLMASSKNHSI